MPFAGQESRWPGESRRLYDFILDEADAVHIVSDGSYTPAKRHVRDTWMIDHAGRLIAVWDGRIYGGTFATVKYARAGSMSMLQIDPLQRRMVDSASAPLLTY